MIRKTVTGAPLQVGNGKATFVISTDEIDMCGDRVLQSGLDTSVFRNNPIGLWAHDPAHVVGTWSPPVTSGGRTISTLTFAGTDHAQEKRQLVESGIVKTCSIGFDALEFEPIDPSRPRAGKIYTRSRLLEISLVSIPANPSAQLIDFQDKGKDPSRMTREERIARVAELEAGAQPQRRGPQLSLREKELRRATAHQSLVVADLDADSVEARQYQVARIEASIRRPGLEQDIIDKAVLEERERRSASLTTHAPSWASGGF